MLAAILASISGFMLATISVFLKPGAIPLTRLPKRASSLAQQTVPGTANGTATHAVIVDTVNSAIKAVTTAPNYNMANGTKQTVPQYDVWEIEDPT